ncbi:hypothetical protein ACIP5Z_02245 [Rothia terrae]|uniref:hypothetical protein n=1 Tax=Rothia terrae TaxID=396015 RepID=UPI003820DC1E
MATNQMAMVASSQPEPRKTEPRYWFRRRNENWFKGTRALARVSVTRMTDQLAEISRGMPNASEQKILSVYRAEHGITKDKLRERANWERQHLR